MNIQIQYKLQDTIDVYESVKGIVLVSTQSGRTVSPGLDEIPVARALQSDLL